MKKQALERELITFPIVLGTGMAIFDLTSSILLINYSNLGLCEMSPLVRDEHGLVDITKASLVTLAKLVAYITLSMVLYCILRKPTQARYSAIHEIIGDYWPFMYCLGLLYGLVFATAFVAVVWNPYILMSTQLNIATVPGKSGYVLAILFGTIVALYALYCVAWRYLVDDAKRKNPHLAWPYKWGWMKEDDLG